MDLGDIDWGDFPTWVSAATTALALIAAGLVVWIEMRRDREMRRERERSEQAAVVAAWHDEMRADRGDAILLRNGSPLPIYDVQVGLVDLDEAVRGRRPHAQYLRRRRAGSTSPCRSPLFRQDRRIPYPQDLAGQMYDSYGNPTFQVGRVRRMGMIVTFWDAAGRGWWRDPTGQLKRRATSTRE